MSTTTTTTTTTTAPKTTTLVGMLPGATSTAAAGTGSEKHSGEKGFMSQGHYHSPEDSQRRIKELESQVQFFKVQTSGAGKNNPFNFFSFES